MQIKIGIKIIHKINNMFNKYNNNNNDNKNLFIIPT